MSEFTKGPWSNDDYIINAKDCCIEIAKVTVFNQGKANANLIASAPDMYDLLKRLTSHDNCKKDIVHLLCEADSLLAKARGEL